MPCSYEEKFERANEAFLYSIVFDPDQQCQRRETPSDKEYPLLGEMEKDSVTAKKMATLEIYPDSRKETGIQLGDFNPFPPRQVSNSMASYFEEKRVKVD